MRHIYIMSGVPGSGKSHWVDAHAGSDAIVLRRDDVRESLRSKLGFAHGMDVPAKTEYENWMAYCKAKLLENPDADVYIDQTTLTTGSFDKLMNGLLTALTRNDCIHIICIHTSLKECLRRNELREGDAKVPASVIESMDASRRRQPISISHAERTFPLFFFSISHEVGEDGQ